MLGFWRNLRRGGRAQNAARAWWHLMWLPAHVGVPWVCGLQRSLGKVLDQVGSGSQPRWPRNSACVPPVCSTITCFLCCAPMGLAMVPCSQQSGRQGSRETPHRRTHPAQPSLLVFVLRVPWCWLQLLGPDAQSGSRWPQAPGTVAGCSSNSAMIAQVSGMPPVSCCLCLYWLVAWARLWGMGGTSSV